MLPSALKKKSSQESPDQTEAVVASGDKRRRVKKP
jgi:hypothetical protein